MAETEFDYLTRAELCDYLKFKEDLLNNLSIKTEPASGDGKQAQEAVKNQLKTEIEQIKTTLKVSKAVAATTLPVAEMASASAQNYDKQMVKTMRETATIQNLLDVIRAVPKLSVGDSIERFVSELDQIFKVEVQPQLGEISSIENEFVRATKRLLTFSMYEQMDKSSGTDTESWNGMKKYLIENHGSKITMFQHLNRLWRLEPKPEEKLTDYGARVEESIHKASLHIMKKFGKDHASKDMTAEDVFKLIGAMLVSLQVQKEHEFIYRAMIKTMDKHWTAGELLADAQDYVDRLGSDQNAIKTGAEVAFHSMENESADDSSDESTKVLKELQQQLEANTKAIQSLTLTNTSSQTGGRSVTVSQEDIDKILQAGKGKPRDQQICLHFLNGKCNSIGKCRYGRKHVSSAQVFMANQEDIEPEIPDEYSELDELFQ